MQLNAIATNVIFEVVSIDIFNIVYYLSSAQNICLMLEELHSDRSHVHEQKCSVSKQALNWLMTT